METPFCPLSSPSHQLSTAALAEPTASPVVFVALPYAPAGEEGLFGNVWAALKRKEAICQLSIRTQIRGLVD